MEKNQPKKNKTKKTDELNFIFEIKNYLIKFFLIITSVMFIPNLFCISDVCNREVCLLFLHSAVKHNWPIEICI